jgi:hypothetical protein
VVVVVVVVVVAEVRALVKQGHGGELRPPRTWAARA